MTFCKFCGQELTEESIFCPRCGKSQTEEQKTPTTTVKTGTYFGLLLLFMLPIVGVIASLIFALVAENPNLKNFARAAFVWTLIGTLVCLVVVGISFWLIEDYILPADGYEYYQYEMDPFEEFDPFDDWDDFRYPDRPQWEPYF